MARTKTTKLNQLLLLCLVIFCGTLFFFAANAEAGVRVQPSSLTYLGTIDVTATEGSCGYTSNARALGLTYNPSGNGGAGSFYLSGRLFDDCMGEITKPTVGGTATFLQNYTHVLNGTIDNIDDCYNGCYIGGHLLFSGNLYVSAFSYYDATFSATKSVWRRSPTLSSLTGFTGPVGATPGVQGFTSQYMDNVPSAFQSMLGGPAVIGSCCMSIITRTSLGPSLSSFDPANLGTATTLISYPDGHQTLNPFGASGSHPEANPTTKMGGVTFVEGSDTVLFVGNTGKGEYCYGDGTANQSLHGTLVPGYSDVYYCYDPDGVDMKGTHAYPYVHYMWAYDVDDLAAVKAGTAQPWDVLPYATWELPNLGGVNDEWSALGITFDPTANRLYILKSRDESGAPDAPQLHVYNVSGLASDSTPPAPPSGLAVQ